MSYKMNYPRINLQLFAEGGAEGGMGSEGASGVNSGVPYHDGDLSGVTYGKQTQPQSVSPEDRTARFEELIKGEYKDLYDARMSDTIQKRLKSSKETVDKYNALAPTLDLLGRKYGVDASDINALNKAIEEDDSYYEDEALERGISVEQLKEIRKMERENAELKRQMQEQSVKENADRIYTEWMKQSEALKGVYPNFDLNLELQNGKFVDLIKNNVDVRTAYEVVHKDEIIPAAMKFTADKVKQQISNSIIANGARPTENGINSQSSALVKPDVSMLTKEDRAEIIRRVAKGEKISF